MPALDYNMEYLQAGLAALESYLLSKTLFWPLQAVNTGSLPQLTLGGLLYARQRCRAQNRTAQQVSALNRCESELESARSRWRVAWEQKSDLELGSRLRQWGNYLNDLIKESEEQAPYYPGEVRLRVFIELLIKEIHAPARDTLDWMEKLDQSLKMILRPGDFIWDQELAAAFPRETYWYLWGFPASL